MKRWIYQLTLAGLAVSLAALSSPAARSQPPAGPPQKRDIPLAPGVIVEADRSEAYVMRPEGGLEAVDLNLGRTLWITEAGSRPLAVERGLLLAQAESPERGREVDLVLLDRASGNAVRQVRLDLDEELWTGIDKGLGASFSLKGWIENKKMRIAWSCREEVVGGANLSRPPAREERGAAEIDPPSGRVSSFNPGQANPPRRPEWRLPRAERLETERGRQFLSADEKHILVSERTDDDRVWAKYRWIVFDRKTRERLGEMRSPWSLTEFLVVDHTLLQVTPAFERRLDDGSWEEAPLSLRAVDLRGGAELWQRPVRDTEYRGPFPP